MSLKEITFKNSVKVLNVNDANQIKGGRRRKRNKPITLSSGGGTPPPIMASEAGWSN